MPLPVKQKMSGSNISPLPPCICTGSDIHHHLQSKENTQTVAFTFVTYIYDTKSGMTMDYFENVWIDIMHRHMVSKSGMTTMDNWS